MDSFSILCTTCKTRLKVRDEGAIGKILACPKCGGMVMVKPPAQWEAAADEQGSTRTAIPNSASGTQPMALLGDASAFDDVDDLLAGRTPAPPAPSPPAPVAASMPPAHAAPNKSPAEKPQATKTPQVEGKEPAAVKAPVAATAIASKAPMVPSELPAETEEPPLRPDWEANRPWRYWFSLSCAGLAGTLLALVVVMVTIRMFQRRPALAQAASPAVTAVVHAPEATEPPAVPASDEEAPAANPAKEPSEPSAPVSPAPPSSDNTSSEPPKPASPPESEDPLGLLPKEETPATKTPAKENASDDALATLSKVGKLLGESKPEVEPKLDDKPVPLPTDSDPSLSPAPPALPRPEPRTIDVAARLADKVPEIKADDTPLAEFLQFMLEFTTVPITLEPESLIWVRATHRSPVKLHLANTTVGEVLKSALAPLKLEPQVSENQILVTLPSRLVTIPYPTGDLTGDDPGQIALLTELVRETIEPESWKGEAGATLTEKKDTLEVKHVPSVQLQVLTLMEKLRVARGLTTRSKFEPALFRLAARYERARSRLIKPISCNFSQPTSLIRVLQQLSEAGSVEILIDWRSLMSEGWTPDSVATLVIDKRPLETALHDLLTPMDLAFRVVDERTLQVVSARDLEERLDLELYAANDLYLDGQADALLTKIRAALGEEHFRDGGGKGSVALDAASRHLVALLPQPQQRALADLLEEWRKEGK